MLRLFLIIALRILTAHNFTGDWCAHVKNGGFFFVIELAREVNRHFLENEYGNLSFFFLFV